MSLSDKELITIVTYNRIAESRRGNLTTNHNFWLPEFLDIIKGQPVNPKFMDLGSGDGRDASLYKSHFGNLNNYVGIDLSQGMLTSALRRDLVKEPPFVLADMYTLPIMSEQMDIIWSAASLIHTPRDQIHVQLSEIYRCLKDKGKVFISVKYGQGEGWEISPSQLDSRYVVYWKEDDILDIMTMSKLIPERLWVCDSFKK